MKRLWCLVGIMTCFALSCSSGGSGSGGGGSSIGGSTTYKKEDLAGSWSYSARQQGGGNSCNGTMTFDRDVHLTGITNSCCPQGQILSDIDILVLGLRLCQGAQLRLVFRSEQDHEIFHELRGFG